MFGWVFWNDGLLWMARQVDNVLDFWISSWINGVLAKSLSRAPIPEHQHSGMLLHVCSIWNSGIIIFWNYGIEKSE